ncbi:NADH:flavin oxidoreductase [Paenibacillus agricola]|uniref:NADH:flavin oxidoreductase n=1 Tax=Paenibacillus agricola TaxID=2716264 RepID=A0ABX0JH95_9BACL|nr:NADH:flavin oxidoreductase [Paenibacillus agricola]NHN35567.1 NADH:flavin oxidoreductase [Paenibacillus agricola]
MSASTTTLLLHYQLANLTLKNRVVLAPMTRISATPDGRATEAMARYYANFAAGGFGLLITESSYTDTAYSQGALNQPGITNVAQIEAWKTVTDAVHSQGSKIIAQLAHAGALSQFTEDTVSSSSYTPEGERSPIYGSGGAFPTARALTKDAILELVESFENAAVNAKKAGFDGVEIHSANGFLPDQFLTDYTNQRTDEYGGSLENRLRFLLEIIRAVKAKMANDFVVGVRISQAKMNNFTYKWPNGDADAKFIFESLAAAGVDYIHTYEYHSSAPAFGESGPTLAELAKKYSKTTVIVNGGITEPEEAEGVLNQGGDLVALAKIALSNPDWPMKVQRGQAVAPFDGQVLAPQPSIKESELLPLNRMQARGV